MSKLAKATVAKLQGKKCTECRHGSIRGVGLKAEALAVELYCSSQKIALFNVSDNWTLASNREALHAHPEASNICEKFEGSFYAKFHRGGSR